MEETFKVDSQHSTAIVSNLTTITTENNGTSGDQADGQPINDYDPDSKCEMTTLEKAYYEPPPTNKREQEQEPDNGACNLNQTSFDPQVIEDYVESGGCQQFIQNLDNSKDLVDATTSLESTKDIIDSTIESFEREMRAQPNDALNNLTNPIQTPINVEEPQVPQPENPIQTDLPVKTHANVESSDPPSNDSNLNVVKIQPDTNTQEKDVQQEEVVMPEEQVKLEENVEPMTVDSHGDIPKQENLVHVDVPAQNVENKELVDECAEREKLVEALISNDLKPIDEQEIAPQEKPEKLEEDVEIKLEEPIQTDKIDQLEEPVEPQDVKQSEEAIQPEQEEQEEDIQQEETKLMTKEVQPEQTAQPEPQVETEKPVVQDEQKDEQEKPQDILEEPVITEEAEPSIKTGRSRRSTSKTKKTLPTRASKRHQPQEVHNQAEASSSQQEPLHLTDLNPEKEPGQTNGAHSAEEVLEEPQKPAVTRKRLLVDIDSKTSDDKPKEKLSTPAIDKPIDDRFRKYQCLDCGYSTDRINNIVYHKKSSCQHLKQSWNDSVKNYISGLVKSPKSNKKRRLR